MLLGAGALKRSPILYRFSMYLSNTHCPRPRLSRQPCSQNQEESVAPVLTPSWMWLFSPLTWVQPQPTLSAGNGQMSRWRFTCGCSLGAIYMKERRVKKVLLWPSRAKGCRLFSSGAGKCKRGRKFRLYSRTLKCCASRGVGRRKVIHRRLLNSLHDRVSSVIISEVIQTFGGGG